MKRRLLAAGLPLALMGCTGGLLPRPAPAPSRHTLDPPAPAGASASASASPTRATPPGARVLQVAPPRAAPGFDSTRMLYLRRAGELQAYALAEWVEPPAQLLATLLVQALQRRGSFAAVVSAASQAPPDLRLETELIRLQQEFTTQPSQARLTLRAVLLDGHTRQVIAWREFDQQAVAPTEDAAGGVTAARTAAWLLLAAVAAFCSEADAARTA